MSESKTPRTDDAFRRAMTDEDLRASMRSLESDLCSAHARIAELEAKLAEQFEIIVGLESDLQGVERERERLRKDAERWRLVRGKVSRIYNEEKMMMDGLRVEVYYDEAQPFLLIGVDTAELFDAAIDAAIAAKEKS